MAFHQQWILFCLTEIFSFIGGSITSGQEVFGTVGDYFTFKTGVPDSGTILYGTDPIGLVLNKQSGTDQDERFKNRLYWNNQTGFFTLTDLRINDSGLYTVSSTKEEKKKQEYQLKIFEKVSTPEVQKLNYSSPNNEVCMLSCSVKNVGGLNLYWYKDKVLLNETSSSSSPILDLPLEIKNTDDHTFICVASNPVSNHSTTVDITERCTFTKGPGKKKPYVMWSIAVCAVAFTVAILVMVVYLKRKQKNLSSRDLSATEGNPEDVQYSVVTHKKPPQANIRECPAAEEKHQLTTIYDQIRPRHGGNAANFEAV